MSERAQARHLREAIGLLESPPCDYVESLFVYRRTDLDPSAEPRERCFGLQRVDGTPKPAPDVYEYAATSEP